MLIDKLAHVVNASSDYSRVMQDILSKQAKTWGIMSAEKSNLDWDAFKLHAAEVAPQDGGRLQSLVKTIEDRLRKSGVNPDAQSGSVQLTGAENNIRTRWFQEDIASTGFTVVDGVFVGMPERSFFIPGVSREAMRKMAAYYSQYSYVYGVSDDGAGKAHYWLVRTEDDGVDQDGDPNVEIAHLGDPLPREIRKEKKRDMMDKGEDVKRVINPGPDRSELGLRQFTLKPGAPPTTGMLPPAILPEQPGAPKYPFPLDRRAAGYYYGLIRECSKYIGRDHVYRIGTASNFFPSGKPDFRYIRVLVSLTREELDLVISQKGRVVRT